MCITAHVEFWIEASIIKGCGVPILECSSLRPPPPHSHVLQRGMRGVRDELLVYCTH